MGAQQTSLPSNSVEMPRLGSDKGLAYGAHGARALKCSQRTLLLVCLPTNKRHRPLIRSQRPMPRRNVSCKPVRDKASVSAEADAQVRKPTCSAACSCKRRSQRQRAELTSECRASAKQSSTPARCRGVLRHIERPANAAFEPILKLFIVYVASQVLNAA